MERKTPKLRVPQVHGSGAPSRRPSLRREGQAQRLWSFIGLVLLLSACAPQITVRPPGVEIQAPAQPPATPPPGGGVSTPVILVLPGNKMPLVDDFSGYPTGAVLPVVAPDRYGMLRLNREWNKITVVEAFTPQGSLDKAVRIEGWGHDGLLTTGSQDWTNYRVTLRAKIHEAGYAGSGLRARLFLDGAGSRGLEFRINRDGIQLVKIAGDQHFTLIERPELAGVGRAFIGGQDWHDFTFELQGDGMVRVRVGKSEVISWKDPDYRQGGFGIGPGPAGTTFFLDDLRVEPLETPKPPSSGGY